MLIRFFVITLLLLTAGGSSGLAQTAAGETARGGLRIVFAEAPALLIRIDGEPVYRNIPGTDLQQIVNTRVLIVRNHADIHYLKVFDGWMESYGLMGDWSVSGVSPFGEHTTLEDAVEAQTVDLLDEDSSGPGEPANSLEADPPGIVIATEPTALIATDGPPQYETIPGTSLKYLVNTKAKVFREPTDDELYVVVDREWFRAWTTDGPWEYVANDQLPADIAFQIRR
jgi:hypothetical protein